MAVLDACASYRQGLPLMVLALADNGRELRLADKAGVLLMFEAFADRAYFVGWATCTAPAQWRSAPGA